MAEQQSPQAPNEWQTRRSKLAWRALLIFNLAVGAYMFSWPRKKDTSIGKHRKELEKEVKEESIAEEAPSQPTETKPTHDYDYDYDMLLDYESQTNPPPPMLREPIPEDQQRELFKWMLEEKRKVEPKDHEEKKRIDGDKAILKQFFRADSIPRF